MNEIATFEGLVKRVRETFIVGRRRIKDEIVRTYWETGRHIHEHLLHHERAGYGRQVMEQLAGRVEMSESVLRRQNAESFPQTGF